MKASVVLFLCLSLNVFSQSRSEEILENIDILTAKDVNSKKELLAIIDNTFANINKNQLYSYDTTTYLENASNAILEEEKGVFNESSYYNIAFNVYYKQEDYKKVDPVAFYSFIKKNYFFFENKKTRNSFKKSISNLEVRKINDFYVLFRSDWKDNIIVEIDKHQKVISKIIDNVSEYNFFDVTDNMFFKRTSKLIQRETEITFVLKEGRLSQQVRSIEKYQLSLDNIHTFKVVEIKPVDIEVATLKKYSEMQRIASMTKKRLQ
ncbi:MAG: hypothetical protein ACRCVU_20550 [Flavobacterium sp.]